MRAMFPRLAVTALGVTVFVIVGCAEDAPTTAAAAPAEVAAAQSFDATTQHLRGRVRLRAKLAGANEVPAADDDGDGLGVAHIGVEQGEVCFDVRFKNITTGNRAHIHAGAAGVNGGIVVAFFDLQTAASQRDSRLDVLEKRERLDGCVTGLDPALLADIVANPANYYVNVHNSRFPGGAVRAQLEP